MGGHYDCKQNRAVSCKFWPVSISHISPKLKMPIFQIFYYIILMFFFLLLGCGLFFRYCSSSAGKAEDRENIFECQIHE